MVFKTALETIKDNIKSTKTSASINRLRPHYSKMSSGAKNYFDSLLKKSATSTPFSTPRVNQLAKTKPKTTTKVPQPFKTAREQVLGNIESTHKFSGSNSQNGFAQAMSVLKANQKAQEEQRELQRLFSINQFNQHLQSRNSMNVNVRIQQVVQEMDSLLKNGTYSYGVTSEQVDKWIKNNFVVVNGQSRLKPDAALPPVGFDSKGNRVDRERLKQKWKLYMNYVNNVNRYQAEVEARKAMTADMSDTSLDTDNSLADIIRHKIAEGKDYSFFEGVKDYTSKYFWTPLKNREWSVLGLNTLVNLGETLDLPSLGVRAITTRSADDKRNLGEILKDAYSSHENYNVDTGSPVADIIFEVGLDPSLMIGGAIKGSTTAALKGVTSSGITTALKAIGRSSDEVTQILAESQKLVKSSASRLAREFALHGDKNLDNFAVNLARVMKNKGILGTDEETVLVSRYLRKELDMYNKTLEARIVKVALNTNKAIDKVDSALLHASFGPVDVLVQAMRGGRKLYKGFRSTERVTDFASRKAAEKASGMTAEYMKDMEEYLSTKTYNAQTMTEIFEGIEEPAILDFEQAYNKMSKTSDVDESVVGEVFKKFNDSVDRDIVRINDLQVRINNLEKVNVSEVRSSVDKFFNKLTKGKADSLSHFKYNLSVMANDFKGVYDNISNLAVKYENVLKSLDDTIDNAAKRARRTDLQTLVNLERVDVGTYQQLLNVINSGNIDDELSYLVYEFLRVADTEEDALEKLAMIRRAAQAKLDSTVVKTQRTLEDNKSIIKPYMEDEVVCSTVSKASKEFLKKEFTSERLDEMVRVLPEELHGKLYDLQADIINWSESNTISAAEVYESVQNYCRDFMLLETDFGDVQTEIVTSLRDFAKQLIEDDLMLWVRHDTELLDWHLDKLVSFDEAMMDNRALDLVATVQDKNSVLGNLIDTISQNGLVFKDSGSDELVKNVGEVARDIVSQTQSFDAMRLLRSELDPKVSGLSEEQRYAVLDTLFNVSKGQNKDFIALNGYNVQRFIDNTKLWLDANYGSSRVSLDSFREQAVDFNSDLYKRYSKEVADPEIQERIARICEGGHIKPLNDVKVQMLQLILKNPDAIAEFNRKCTYQDVFFTDIETLGLNSSIHDITDIAVKKWVPIDEDASLDEILTVIESNDGTFVKSVKLDEEYIRSHVSEDILKLKYANNPKIANNKHAMMEQYIEDFSLRAGESKYTEKEVISDFIQLLDDSVSESGRMTPCIVTHNNNNFDMNFIAARINKYKAFPVHINQLQDLINYSENSLVMLKNLEKDIVLTADNEAVIRESVSKYFRTMRKSGYGVRGFNAIEYFNNIKKLRENIEVLSDIGDNANVDVLKVFNDDAATAQLLDEVDLFRKDLTIEQSLFKKTTLNPMAFDVMDLDSDSIKLVFSQEELDTIRVALDESNLQVISDYNKEYVRRYYEKFHSYPVSSIDSPMRQVLKINEGSKVPVMGYNKLFSSKSVSRFFDNVQGRMALPVLKDIQNFTNDVTLAIDKQLKSVDLLEGYLEEFRDIITVFKEYAMRTEEVDMLHFVNYLRLPDNLIEAYVIAQKLWDYEPVLASGIVSDEVRRIMDNVDSCHSKIFKHVSSKDPMSMYLLDFVDRPLEIKEFMDSVSRDAETFKTVSTFLEGSSKAAKDDIVIAEMFDEYLQICKYFKEAIDSADYRGVFDAYRRSMNDELLIRQRLRDEQVLDYVCQSEHNLLSHLLFHNQLMIVPVEESRGLIDALRRFDSSKVYWESKNGYVFVGIRKDTTMLIKDDSVYSKEATKMYFRGAEDEVFEAPNYKAIGFSENFLKNDIGKLFKSLDERISRLTNGATDGTLGRVHTLNRQHQLYKSLPKSFVDNILREDISCDARLWHRGSFDLSVLGTTTNSWKIGNENDVDMLMMYGHSLREISKSVQAEKIFIDNYFNNPMYSLRNIFKGTTNRKACEVLQANPDMVCAVLRESDKTSSGYEVKQVNITDKYSFSVAKSSGAIMLPYDEYVIMVEKINDSKFTNKFLKIYSKMLGLTKVGQLMWTGTWVRNYIDGTIKSAGDAGTLVGTMQNQARAMKLLDDYRKVNKELRKDSKFNTGSLVEVERCWDTITKRPSKPIDMSFADYQFIESWLEESIAGGQSMAFKSRQRVIEDLGNKNVGLRLGRLNARDVNDVPDIIGKNVEKFQAWDYAEVEKLVNSQKVNDKVFLERGFTKESFLGAFQNPQLLSDAEYFNYANIVEELARVSGKRVIVGERKRNNIYDAISSKLLSPMSRVEEIIRLGEFMTLQDLGYTRSEIFKKITDSQFNYNLKSGATKYMELFIPFYNFTSMDFLYWVKQIDENPRMIRYLERLWGGLSWDSADISPEERMENKALQSQLVQGNIPLGKSGIFLRLRPSYLSAMDLIYGGPASLFYNVAGPIKLLMKTLYNEMGGDAVHIFEESTMKYRHGSLINDLFSQVPLLGSVYDRYQTAREYLIDRGILPADFKLFETEFRDINFGDIAFQDFLITTFPSVFGTIDRYGEWQGFSAFQKSLEEKGKWYDVNLGKVVDISQKNTLGKNDTTGINFHSKEGWERYCWLRLIYDGVRWDNNTRQFVDVREWKRELLNRDDLTFEEVCYYNEKLFGTKWDNNQMKFVQPDQYIEGGLNREDLSWEELTALQYAIYGKAWSQEEHKFVKVTEPMVVYRLPEAQETDNNRKLIREDNRSAIIPWTLEVYAATKSKKTDKLKIGKKWVLTGDPDHDAAVFEDIMKNGVRDKGWQNFSSGRADGFKFNARKIGQSRGYYTKKDGVPKRPRGFRKKHSLVPESVETYTKDFYRFNYKLNTLFNYQYNYTKPSVARFTYPMTAVGIMQYQKAQNRELPKILKQPNVFDLPRITKYNYKRTFLLLREAKLRQYKR
jgi:hypothetical protein